MNQTCKVCGEPAAGFHFGAFTCEGCKSFFGRSYNNLSSISECKNNGKCIIDKKNRTTCKACRLRKCYTVGMSKGGSRYGRRSNWFKIHCLLQEQQQQALEAAGKAPSGSASAMNPTNGFGDMAAAAAVAAAKQHMQQLNPHMGGLLGYPGYHIPEMMQGASPFMSAAGVSRHPSDAAAAAAIPFFSMMNSLPSIGSSPSAFQLPPHLLFPSAYHSPGAAAAAAAADAAYRSEMFKHRQSVDSAASGESQRYSPAAAHSHSSAEEERLGIRRAETEAACQSPELCVSGDDDEEEHALPSHSRHEPNSAQCDTAALSQSTAPASAVVTLAHHIHSPIPIRATPPQHHRSLPVGSSHSASHPHHSPAPTTPTPAAIAPATRAVTPTSTATAADQTALSFAAKMQALSPVSICSIGGETLLPAGQDALAAGSGSGSGRTTDQDCPMDLSMKTTTSRSSAHSCNTNTSAGDCDLQSEASEEELRSAGVQSTLDGRRKFFHISHEHESDTSSDASGAMGAGKRQKLIDDGYNASGFAHGATATSLRGIFVCV